MAHQAMQVPRELRDVGGAVLEEYVRSRLLQFIRCFGLRVLALAPHLDPSLLEQAVRDTLESLPLPDYGQVPAEALDLQLVFRHDCLALGCNEPQCALCQHNCHRRCTVNFAKKYLVADRMTARCGAHIRVELVDRATGKVHTGELQDISLEMFVVDGAAHDQVVLSEGRAELHDRELAACALLTNNKGQPLLSSATCGRMDEYGRLHLLPVDGCVVLSDVFVTDSSEALLSGRKPPFRLVVRGRHRDGRHVAMRSAVSEPFVVATRRVRASHKVDIPSMDDSVSKLDHMGRETVRKLADLHAAATQAGMQLDLEPELAAVTRVGQFKALALRAEAEGHLRQQLQTLLKLPKDKWDEAAEHAKRAVVPDSRLRAWYADPATMVVGLLFPCRLGLVDLARPLALLQRVLDGNGLCKIEVVSQQRQTPMQRDIARQLLPQAEMAWWQPGHVGWTIFPADTDGAEINELLASPAPVVDSSLFGCAAGPLTPVALGAAHSQMAGPQPEPLGAVELGPDQATALAAQSAVAGAVAAAAVDMQQQEALDALLLRHGCFHDAPSCCAALLSDGGLGQPLSSPHPSEGLQQSPPSPAEVPGPLPLPLPLPGQVADVANCLGMPPADLEHLMLPKLLASGAGEGLPAVYDGGLLQGPPSCAESEGHATAASLQHLGQQGEFGLPLQPQQRPPPPPPQQQQQHLLLLQSDHPQGPPLAPPSPPKQPRVKEEEQEPLHQLPQPLHEEAVEEQQQQQQQDEGPDACGQQPTGGIKRTYSAAAHSSNATGKGSGSSATVSRGTSDSSAAADPAGEAPAPLNGQRCPPLASLAMRPATFSGAIETRHARRAEASRIEAAAAAAIAAVDAEAAAGTEAEEDFSAEPHPFFEQLRRDSLRARSSGAHSLRSLRSGSLRGSGDVADGGLHTPSLGNGDGSPGSSRALMPAGSGLPLPPVEEDELPLPPVGDGPAASLAQQGPLALVESSATAETVDGGDDGAGPAAAGTDGAAGAVAGGARGEGSISDLPCGKSLDMPGLQALFPSQLLESLAAGPGGGADHAAGGAPPLAAGPPPPGRGEAPGAHGGQAAAVAHGPGLNSSTLSLGSLPSFNMVELSTNPSAKGLAALAQLQAMSFELPSSMLSPTGPGQPGGKHGDALQLAAMSLELPWALGPLGSSTLLEHMSAAAPGAAPAAAPASPPGGAGASASARAALVSPAAHAGVARCGGRAGSSGSRGSGASGPGSSQQGLGLDEMMSMEQALEEIVSGVGLQQQQQQHQQQQYHQQPAPLLGPE